MVLHTSATTKGVSWIRGAVVRSFASGLDARPVIPASVLGQRPDRHSPM